MPDTANTAARKNRSTQALAPLLAERPLSTLKGAGAAVCEKLARLNIFSVQDLLFHLPRQYEDRSRITAIGALRPGMSALVEGEVQLADIVFGRRRSLMVKVQDGSGLLTLRFYHFNASQKENLQRGLRLRIFGEARSGASGLEMYHPEYQQAGTALPPPPDTLTPIYPVTEGLSQTKLRQLLAQALALLDAGNLPDLLAHSSCLGLHNPFSLHAALRYVHAPPREADQALLLAGRHAAQQRLIFEELLAYQLSLQKRRAEVRAQRALVLPRAEPLSAAFLQQLPFPLTSAQARVLQEITQDLHSGRPMLRLVQGDVGAGKTVVAALAACPALAAGLQVALMAPTEILAEQHVLNFSRWFSALNIPVLSLFGRHGQRLRRDTQALLDSGQACLLIGTHALFQEAVALPRLALVIIDEQHRFGVHQRLALMQKGVQQGLLPHQLIMTATPIPRSLAMSAYGDLDTSVIDELPPGRSPVQTLLLPQERRAEIISRLHQQCRQGRQAYWVCTLIEESEQLQAQAAETCFQDLQAALPDVRVGLVHGRQKPTEKAAVMQAFKAGQIQLLVATTVIEVGVDVPEASLMVIENPERLGLAQLHQLRGRVGRGAEQSFCVLLYQSPLGALGRERLAIMRETTDGFRIAEKDLELRGPGEVLGTRQTGLLQFRLADLLRDATLMETAQAMATPLLQEDAPCAHALLERWLPRRDHYARV